MGSWLKEHTRKASEGDGLIPGQRGRLAGKHTGSAPNAPTVLFKHPAVAKDAPPLPPPTNNPSAASPRKHFSITWHGGRNVL